MTTTIPGSTGAVTNRPAPVGGLNDRVSELRERAVEGGRQIGAQVKTGSTRVVRAARARPKLMIGIAALVGVGIAAFVFRKRLPGAMAKLATVAAETAVAVGAPKAMSRIADAGREGKARLTSVLEETPGQLADLGDRIVRLKPVRDLRERVRRIA